MISLSIQVPRARTRTATATLRDGSKTLLTGHAAASATPAIATLNSNATCDPLRPWGHPPTGNYQILDMRPAKKEQAAEYGMHILLFEPRSGQALSAEAHGRLGLLVYGGPPGCDKYLRTTQGGVRLSNEMLSAVVKKLGRGLTMTLVIEELPPIPWWQFWKRNAETFPLSDTAVKALTPPLDEKSILDKMLRGLQRKGSAGTASDSPDTRNFSESRDSTRHYTQDSDYARSSSSAGRDTYQGGGGQSAGAGASGGWESASTASSARGVDASGRITTGVAGVAAAAVVGAVAAHALAETQHGVTTTGTAY